MSKLKNRIWNVVEVYDRDYAMATGAKKETIHTGLTFQEAEDLRQAAEYNIHDVVAYYSTETDY